MPERKPARQVAGEGLIDIFGDDAPKAHLAILQIGEAGMKAIEAYAGARAPAPLGEEGQRMEGRRAVFWWLQALRALDADELKTLMQTGDQADGG